MTKKERMYQQIDQHGQRLNNLFNTNLDNVSLCKKLFRLENSAHNITTHYCNGYVEYDHFQYKTESILQQVAKILGTDESNLFINGDARGYAIKFNHNFTKDNIKNMYQDMGGYGIVAPDFREVTQ
jgi:hemoglobin-like flavoprotein